MKKYNKIFGSIWNFLTFFILTAFIVSCCMILFLDVLSSELGVDFTRENISAAAKLTFMNVILLTTIFTIIDIIRRKITVERPVKRIVEAADKMVKGDFTVRIKPTGNFAGNDTFGEIISCFNKLAQELSGVETLRTDFIANVSHEIKTPLTVIQNYATLLSKPGLREDKRREYALATIETTHRLSELISNILRLNKLENQQIFPQLESYDLGEQLRQCILGFEEIWKEKELEMDINILDDVIVKSDREMMSLVWNNLLSNAIKFTDNKGLISLSLEVEADRAVVTVKDSGCGISKDAGKHIFDRFYQADTSHTSKGNGLGLALVKRIIDITGSEISVISQLGKGSSFIVKMERITDGEN